MDARHRNATNGRRRDVSAGVVAASVALLGALSYTLVVGVAPVRLSADAQYWAAYAPQCSAVAGFLVGTVGWRRVVSRASTPRRGALAGGALALCVVVLVPILAAAYVSAFPVLLSVATGQPVRSALSLYPAPLWAAVDVARTVATSWSPFVGASLVPLGALAGWVDQRRGGSGR